jgi:hypothetical protein
MENLIPYYRDLIQLKIKTKNEIDEKIELLKVLKSFIDKTNIVEIENYDKQILKLENIKKETINEIEIFNKVYKEFQLIKATQKEPFTKDGKKKRSHK